MPIDFRAVYRKVRVIELYLFLFLYKGLNHLHMVKIQSIHNIDAILIIYDVDVENIDYEELHS